MNERPRIGSFTQVGYAFGQTASSRRWDQIRALIEKQNALEHRKIARRYLRIFEDRKTHKDFMHEAVRAWSNFKYYSRRSHDGLGS